MAKTFRYIALSLFVLIWTSSQGKQTEMTSIALTATSGTMVLRLVEASKLTVSDDAQYLITENIHLVGRMKEDLYLDANAAKGIVNLTGDTEYAEQLFEEMTEFEILQEYGSNFSDLQCPKDFLLDGDGTPTIATLGDSGRIETEKLIWSELLKSYLMPEKFNQSMTLEDGSVITVTGVGAVIDEELQNWSYYGDKTQQVEMIFTNPDPAQ